MFFLLRSAFCITCVVLALPDHVQPSGALGTRAAVNAVHELCQADPQRCLAFVRDQLGTVWHRDAATQLLDPAAAIAPPKPKDHASADSLLPSDLRPGWRGPAAKRAS